MENEKQKQSMHSRHLGILCSVILLTLVIHVTAFYLIKDMQLNLGQRHANGLRISHENQEKIEVSEQEQQEKEEVLAALFEEFTQKPAEQVEQEPEEVAEELEPMEFAPLENIEASSLIDFDAPALALPSEELQWDEPPPLPLDLSSTDTQEIDPGAWASDASFASNLMEETDRLQSYASSEATSLDAEAFTVRGKRGREFLAEGSEETSLPSPGFNPMAAIASSQDFTVEVSYTPKEEGEGYIFELKLIPKPDATFRKISNNVFFVIDRSHSIDKERYEQTKNAVSKALELLEEGDTFNILVFDKNVVRFAEQTTPINPENIQKGQAFLRSQRHGGLFASTELYSSLDKIIPEAVADTEVNTVILFSDGETLLKQSGQRASVAEWTSRNRGKVALFSVTAGRSNNQALLEVLSRFNKGWLVHADSYSQIESVLSLLIHAVRRPIGKEMVATAVIQQASDKKGSPRIYPRNQRLPELYEGMPYTLYGDIDKLEDFYLFVQGKYYHRWLDIRQKISFKQAKQSTETIERYWALHRAYDYYDAYLNEGNGQSVREANALLNSHQLPQAFR